MSSPISISRLQLLLRHAHDFQGLMSGIAHRFELGGAEATAALKELKGPLGNQFRGVLYSLSDVSSTETGVSEVGAQLLCTAVRACDVIFSKEERVLWFEAFRPMANYFAEPGLKGRLLGNLGNALADCGRLDEAKTVLQERLQCAVAEADQVAEGLAKEHLGKLYLRQGHFTTADMYLEQAYRLATSIGERETETRLLKDMADVALRKGQHIEGIQLLEERLERCEQKKDTLLILSTCHILAERLLVIGDTDQSKIYANRAADLAKLVRLPQKLAGIQGTLGNIALEEKKFDVAQQHFMNARKIFRRCQRIVEQAMTATSLGLTAWKVGKLQQAIRWFREALEVDKATGHSNSAAIDLGNLAGVLEEIGDYSGAVACYSERIDILEQIGERQRARETCIALANLHAASSHFEQAISTINKALEYYTCDDKERSNEIRISISKWRDQIS